MRRGTRSLAAAALFGAAIVAAGFAGSSCGGDTGPVKGEPINGSSHAVSSGTGGEGGTGGSAVSTSSGTGGIPEGCGDGVVKPPIEECDGDDLGGNSCTTLPEGFAAGALACAPNCKFDTSGCFFIESCNDAMDNDKDGKVDCADSDCAAACADSCSAAGITMIAEPLTFTGDTLGHASLLQSSCGGDGPELVYQVTPANTGVLELRLTSQVDLGMSVRTACGQAASEIGCVPGFIAAGATVPLKVPVTAGTPVFVVVEGFAAGDEGGFLLDVVSHTIACGDGYTDGAEECDDGNLVSADGCSAACVVEATESESNNTHQQADAYASPWFAAVTPAGDVDFVAIDVPSIPASIIATVSDFDGKSCTDFLLDSEVAIFDTNGTTKLATNDNTPSGGCSTAQTAVASPGTYYVRVQASPAAFIKTFPYQLDVQVTSDVCGDGAQTGGEQCDDNNTNAGDGCSPTCQFELDETEPNNTAAQANAYSSPWHATISPATDKDVVSVMVPGPSSKLTAQIVDYGTGGCADLEILSKMELLGTNGTSVLATDTGNGIGYCAYFEVPNLAAGKYYLRVSAGIDPMATFLYGLDVTIQ